jgi:type 1 glutamine amidotransferase
VYTKNGSGYVHDNIPSAVEAIKQLGADKQFKVDVSDNPMVFEEKNLMKYRLLIFTSTNNDVFESDLQRLAFRHYIEAGGGFVGIHSVTGTERKWNWFKMMVGETFTWHAKFQSFSVININPEHPSMKGVPIKWTKEDECYFGAELYPGINTLLMHDVSTLDSSQKELINKHKGGYGNYFPAAWTQHFQGGHIWVTTLGHAKENYKDSTFLNHLWQGIHYIAEQVKAIDFSKVTSRDKDEQLKF